MSSPEIRWIVTANFTADGGVAYRRADGTWSRVFAESGVFATEEDALPIVQSIVKNEQRLISDPYGIDVGWTGSTIEPLTARERIRRDGPTVPIRRPDSGVRSKTA
jgi:Protein of unknown function (DUF2849)